jgi:pimeloyl-[acyl-carrier protein] synthase
VDGSQRSAQAPRGTARRDPTLSLYRLLDPEVLADPYPLYKRLREHGRVHWDPFLHAWVATGYHEVLAVLHKFSANRLPAPEQLSALGLGALEPVAQVLVKQMLYLDAPAHTRLRGLCSIAFTSRRVEHLKWQIQAIADDLIDRVIATGRIEMIADFAGPLPAIVTAGMLGLPTDDHEQLKDWSADFAEMIGNFQHNSDRADGVLRRVEDMIAYFRSAVRDQTRRPREGLIHSLITAEVDGARLTEEEVVANAIITMVGGQETTTNLIGNGILTLLRQPDKLAQLRDDPSIVESAVEELLRFESPSQQTGRVASEDIELGGQLIRKREGVIAVMAAANRDPDRFPDPERLDLTRTDNRHLAFGWAAHFCFGAPLARIEAQIAFPTLLRRLRDLELAPGPLEWRENIALRGLKALPLTFAPAPAGGRSAASAAARSAAG